MFASRESKCRSLWSLLVTSCSSRSNVFRPISPVKLSQETEKLVGLIYLLAKRSKAFKGSHLGSNPRGRNFFHVKRERENHLKKIKDQKKIKKFVLRLGLWPWLQRYNSEVLSSNPDTTYIHNFSYLPILCAVDQKYQSFCLLSYLTQ